MPFNSVVSAISHLRGWLWGSRNVRGIVIGLTCTFACYLAGFSSEFRAIDNWALDSFFQIRDSRRSSAPIVIVSIDDESLRLLKKPLVQISPELAEVTRLLVDRGAIAVGIDLLLGAGAEDLDELRPGRQGDAEKMGQVVGETQRVVLSQWVLGAETPILPPYSWENPIDAKWHDKGYVDLTLDEDNSLRSQQLLAKVGNELVPCLALAMFGKGQAKADQWLTTLAMSQNSDDIPTINGQMMINYVGPPSHIPRVSFGDLLEEARGGPPVTSARLDGSYVLIGADLRATQDMRPTPYAAQQSGLRLFPLAWLSSKPELMSGVEIHANILATLHDKAYITTPFWLHGFIPLAAMGTVLGLGLIRVRFEMGLLLTVMHHLAWKIIALAAFLLFDWRVEMASMLLLGPLIYALIFSLRWRWVRRMMGLFKSEAIAQAMEANPRGLELLGQEQIVTVFFSDIRGFTTISENRTPRFVVSLLNDYFTAIVPVIEAHGGVINQYMGDGIMVLFNAPQPLKAHALQAVRAGKAVVAKIHDMKDHWESLGLDGLRIGVGIHTGVAITGTVGSPGRLDYSAIGDTVNSAARIEAATKSLGVELLFSQRTLDEIPSSEHVELQIDDRPHEITVKGKKEPLVVYTIREM